MGHDYFYYTESHLFACLICICTLDPFEILTPSFGFSMMIVCWLACRFLLFLFLAQVANILTCFVGSTDQESSQQLRTWFSEHFFAPKLVA